MANLFVVSMKSEKKRNYLQVRKDKAIESKLEATTISMEKYNKIHLTCVVVKKVLLEGFSRSYKRFFLYNNGLQVEIDQAIVKKDLEYFKKYMIVNYLLEVNNLPWLS